MRFKASSSVNVMVNAAHWCGDGCCSWRETEWDPVFEGREYEPNFDVFSDYPTDPEYFWYMVENGDFEPVDEEAKTWFEEKTAEYRK